MSNYIQFYGLKEAPFTITPDIEFFYSSAIHREALMSLHYMVESGEGFFVLSGEPGTGKTFTIRKFLSELDESKVEYAYIIFPNLSPEEMFMAILEDFGIEHPADKSKNWLFSKLKDFLLEKKAEGKKVLFIVDEAQNLPIETMEELRVISNLETEKEKLLQIVMAGQPELDKKLSSERLRQLKQRITLHSKLDHLSVFEMEDFIKYRLNKAGGSGIIMSKPAVKALYDITKGVPRMVCLMMERVLMAAFLDESFNIAPRHVKNAANSLNLSSGTVKGFSKSFTAVLIGLVLVFSLIGIAMFMSDFKDDLSLDSMKSVEKTENKLIKKEETAAEEPEVKKIEPVKIEPVKEEANVENVVNPKEIVREKVIVVEGIHPAEYDIDVFKQVTKDDPVEYYAKINVVDLNIRKGPGFGYEVLKTLDLGKNLGVVKIEILDGETWGQVLYIDENQKKAGWVSIRYIKKMD